MTSDRMLREGGKQTSSIEPGSMYTYYYSPKHKDTLQYYDVFPLVIPYRETENGFIGLNLHYLPPFYRIKLLDALMKYASNDKLNRNTKLNANDKETMWKICDAIAKMEDRTAAKNFTRILFDAAFSIAQTQNN